MRVIKESKTIAIAELNETHRLLVNTDGAWRRIVFKDGEWGLLYTTSNSVVSFIGTTPKWDSLNDVVNSMTSSGSELHAFINDAEMYYFLYSQS